MAERLATDADLLAVAPPMSAVLEATRLVYLDLAADLIDVAEFGARASHGHALLTAHLLAVAGIGPGLGGAIASKSIGALSVSYASSGGGPDDLNTTRWGQAFKALSDGLGMGGVVGRTGDPFVLTGGRT